MARDNDVFQVLVTKGNQAILAKGKKVEELAPDQIGIFDANTTLSVDGTTPVKEFFIAVGVDKDGDGVVDSINQSAGQTIQTRGIGAYSFRPHTPGKPMVVEISDFKILIFRYSNGNSLSKNIVLFSNLIFDVFESQKACVFPSIN